MGKQEEINKYRARGCKREWPSENMCMNSSSSHICGFGKLEEGESPCFLGI